MGYKYHPEARTIYNYNYSCIVRKRNRQRLKDGEHSLLLRVSQVLEKSGGFDKSITGTGYLGSPQKIFFRYRYIYKIYCSSVCWEKKMPENNSERDPRIKASIFIHFICLQGGNRNHQIIGIGRFFSEHGSGINSMAKPGI